MTFNRGWLAGFAMLAASAVYAEPATLTLASWGGAYGKSQQKAFVDDYMKETGNKVLVEDYSGGLAQIRSQVKTGNVMWDVVDLELQDAIRACDEGLLEPLDPNWLAPAADGTPASQDYEEDAITKCAVGSLSIGYIIAYNDTKFAGQKPSTVADFFDLKKFPGKRGMKKSPRATMEWALMADGVAPGELYKELGTPQGVDRAFRKLDEIKDSIIWWEAGAQPPQLLSSGEVVMSTAYNGRIYDAVMVDKQPFKLIWDGQIQFPEMFGIVAGTKNLEAAKQLVAAGTKPKVLADQTQYISYGPLRKSALQFVDPSVRPFLPTAPENMRTAVHLDAEWWADHLDGLNQKFSTWLGK